MIGRDELAPVAPLLTEELSHVDMEVVARLSLMIGRGGTVARIESTPWNDLWNETADTPVV